jgi:hypothetical protein
MQCGQRNCFLSRMFAQTESRRRSRLGNRLTSQYQFRMTAPDLDESNPRRRWQMSLAVMLVLVFVVYPLSSGPANVLLHHVHPNVQAVIRVIYAPLGLVLEKTGTETMGTKYLEWWADLFRG